MNPFRTDTDIQIAFNNAFDTTGEATQEKVDAAVKTVYDEAALVVGAGGLYVNGSLDPDNQCVLFRFKRPAISLRVQYTIDCVVPKPERAQDAKADETGQVDDEGDDDDDSGLSDERSSLFASLAEELGDDEFTSDHKPKVEALNELLEEGVEPFTAAERDELWGN